eukprot:4209441-Prymnesium_polylepis.1
MELVSSTVAKEAESFSVTRVASSAVAWRMTACERQGEGWGERGCEIEGIGGARRRAVCGAELTRATPQYAVTHAHVRTHT